MSRPVNCCGVSTNQSRRNKFIDQSNVTVQAVSATVNRAVHVEKCVLAFKYRFSSKVLGIESKQLFHSLDYICRIDLALEKL